MSAPRDSWWPDYRGDRFGLGRGWRLFCWQCGHLTVPHLYVDWRSSPEEKRRWMERAG